MGITAKAASAQACRLALLGVALIPGVARSWAENPSRVDYNRDVRPILSANCFACHGPDETKRRGGVRLDLRDTAIRPIEGGDPPLLPGDPDRSGVIDRVTSEDADAVMPPPSSHKTLKPSEKEILRRWVAEGAEYKPHWAFVRPIRPAVPAVRDRDRVRNEIDAFVLSRLEATGLAPSPEADRATLIRRLSLDLIGLPPSPAEVHAFLADSSPTAYETLVDRLLASPHYGERWARRWLDRARYADTNGYEKDRERSIWPYRDWVIRALNEDMPFDRFTIEQIAGDMLPGASTSQKVATGFHRNTMINEEGGIDVEEFRFASVVDRVATTGSAWLGLTVQCAQCHTHKYDPITHKDYYQFLAFFDNSDEPDLDISSPEVAAGRAEIELRAAEMERRLESQFPARDPSADWVVLGPTLARSESGATLSVQPDGSILATGPTPDRDSYTVVVETPLAEIAAVKLETFVDPTLPHQGPGRAPNGNFVLQDFRATASPLGDPAGATRVAFNHAEADASQAGFDVKGAIDSDPASGWAVDDGSGHFNKPRSATFAVAGKAGFAGGTRLEIRIDQKYGGKHVLGRFRLSARAPTPEPTDADRREHLARKQSEWEQRLRPRRWEVLTPSRVISRKNATMTVLADRSVLASGDKPNNDTYDLEFETTLDGITALRLEVLPDASLPDGGPGRAPLFSVGDFLLTGLELRAKSFAGATDWQPAPFDEASQDYAEPGKPAALAIDEKPDTGWSIRGGVGRAHAAVFTLKQAVGDRRGTNLALAMHQDGIHQTTIGRFRVSATTDPRPIAASGLPADVEDIVLLPSSRRTAEQSDRLKRHYLSIAPELAGPNRAIAELRRSAPKYATTMVMQERPTRHRRTTRIRRRGEFLQPTEAVSPGVPEFLPPLPEGSPRDRLALARWLASEENPLVARVAVNQAWQAFFGRGLVATVEDFGVRGDEPTHPELLDWLATEFPRRGWSMKAMHRLIVTSATYRQASRVSKEMLAIDPSNLRLARGARFRLDAEVIRDLALSAGGLLDPTIGGPSVFPPQPDGVTSLAYGQGGWPTSQGPARYRRGLYTFWKRTAPYAAFLTFDAPTSDAACPRRERSNTPLQALTLLNDGMYVEAAQALARRVVKSGPASFEARADAAFRLCLARPPRPEELTMLKGFHDEQMSRFPSRLPEARAAAGIMDRSVGDEEAVVLATWTAIARVLLNLDETITRP